MELIIVGIVVAINFIVIYYKFNSRKFVTGAADLGFFFLMQALGGASFATLVVTNIASLAFTIALAINPPKLGTVK